MSFLIFESKTVLEFKVIRKVTDKDLSEVKRREKSYKRHCRTCYFKWHNISHFLGFISDLNLFQQNHADGIAAQIPRTSTLHSCYEEESLHTSN